MFETLVKHKAIADQNVDVCKRYHEVEDIQNTWAKGYLHIEIFQFVR